MPAASRPVVINRCHIDNQHRIIDVIRDSLFLFAESLNATGDRFSMYGFSSRKCNQVRVHAFKYFDEPGVRRLLLVLTDARPDDLGRYEGRYGIEASRQLSLHASMACIRSALPSIEKAMNICRIFLVLTVMP